MREKELRGKIEFLKEMESEMIGICERYEIVRGKGEIENVLKKMMIGKIVVKNIEMEIEIYIMLKKIGMKEKKKGYVIENKIIELKL